MSCDCRDAGHHHHHGHAHAHGMAVVDGSRPLDRAMLIGVVLNAAFVLVEAACGLWAGSLALLADAGHNAGDVVGLLLAWGAARLARRPPGGRYTWGFRRSTIYAALLNAMLLLAACGAMLWEAAHRLWVPEPVGGWPMIAVAAMGVVINTVTAMLFMRGRESDANVRGAFLHMAADAAVSAGVVVAGVAILLTGWNVIDPVVSILITTAIVAGTWTLFRESLDLALDAVPRGIEPDAITAALTAIPGVTGLHDLHVWGASTSEASLTVHLVVPEAGDRDRVLADASADLRRLFRIAHVTIQIEDEAAARNCSQRPDGTL